MRRLLFIASLFVALAPLGGCWVSGPEVQDKIDAIPVQDVPGTIEIQSVDPPWGTDAGGSTVTITASPVGQGAVVRFGGTDGDVVSIEGDQIVVHTPAGSPGLVDVEVQWGAKTGSMSDAFQYFPDGSGRVGAIGAVAWFHIVGDFLQTGNTDQGYAWVNFTDPMDYDYTAFYGTGLDTCTSAYSFPGTISEVTDATQIQLSREQGDGLNLAWNSDYDAFDSDLSSEGTLGVNAWASHATYDLDALVGVTSYPAITVKSFVQTPGPFDVSVMTPNPNPLDPTPYVEQSLDSSLPPAVDQSNLQILWDQTDPGDYVLLRLDMYADSGSVDPSEEVRCLVRDDGSFTVPGSVWTSSPPSFSELDIWVGRAKASGALLPQDASVVGVAGVYWVVGALAFYAN